MSCTALIRRDCSTGGGVEPNSRVCLLRTSRGFVSRTPREETHVLWDNGANVTALRCGWVRRGAADGASDRGARIRQTGLTRSCEPASRRATLAIPWRLHRVSCHARRGALCAQVTSRDRRRGGRDCGRAPFAASRAVANGCRPCNDVDEARRLVCRPSYERPRWVNWAGAHGTGRLLIICTAVVDPSETLASACVLATRPALGRAHGVEPSLHSASHIRAAIADMRAAATLRGARSAMCLSRRSRVFTT